MKYGRLPALIPAGVKVLDHYVAGALPHAPQQVTVPAFPDWAILGNDRYGDCGVAGLQHGFEADATIVAEAEAWPTDQQAIDYYLAYTGGQDSGVVLSQYLAHVRQTGYYGHGLAGYAPLDVHNVPTLQSCVFLYGFAYTGITVTDTMEQQFQAGQPWDASPGNPVGGHCVPVVGYDDSYLYVVTWGQVQPVTWSAWHRIADEAWAVLTDELVAHHGDGRGVNIAALQADLSRL